VRRDDGGRGGSGSGSDSWGRVGAAGGERERAAEDGARHVFEALPPQGADRWSLIDVTTDPRRFVVGLAQHCLCPFGGHCGLECNPVHHETGFIYKVITTGRFFEETRGANPLNRRKGLNIHIGTLHSAGIEHNN
jgi:hypothetical protein